MGRYPNFIAAPDRWREADCVMRFMLARPGAR